LPRCNKQKAKINRWLKHIGDFVKTSISGISIGQIS
jgi:hypothetical protein